MGGGTGPADPETVVSRGQTSIFYRVFSIAGALILQAITPALKNRSGHLDTVQEILTKEKFDEFDESFVLSIFNSSNFY